MLDTEDVDSHASDARQARQIGDAWTVGEIDDEAVFGKPEGTDAMKAADMFRLT